MSRVDYDAMMHAGEANKAAWEAWNTEVPMSWLRRATDVGCGLQSAATCISAEIVEAMEIDEVTR